jgi:hypothetical protein
VANTWRATAQAVAFANPKAMLDVYNNSAARVIRIYRAYCFNNQWAAVTGVIGYLSIIRTTSSTGGTTVSPIPHDTNNTSLDANVTAGYGRTVGVGGTYRRLTWHPDEPSVFTVDIDALLTLVPFAEIWNSGYGDSNVEPLLCRASQAEGYCIYSATMTAGLADLEMEFTDAAS